MAQTGTVTTTTTKSSSGVQGLNWERAKVYDRDTVVDLRAELVEDRYNRLIAPNGNYSIEEQKDNGDLKIYSSDTGQYYDYPGDINKIRRDNPDVKERSNRRNINRTLDNQTERSYNDKIVNEGYDPPAEAKGSNYRVTPITTETEKTVKNVGEGGTNTESDGVAEAEETNAGQDASSVDGSGAGHTVDTSEDNSSVSLDDVKKDHTRAPVQVFNEQDPITGEPIPGTGGIKYLTAEEAQKLADEGRIKRSLLQDHRRVLRLQEKAKEKGNWPVPENHTILEDGSVAPNQYIARNPDTNELVDSRTGNVFTGRYGEDPDINETVTNSVRGPRVRESIAGVPSEHKVKLYTKDPSWLDGTLSPLLKTGNGVIFPYTPTINVNHSANYGSYDINQSVNQPHFYQMTPNISIQITAVFTANTLKEAEYMLACMHFFRTATKSDFGAYENGIRRTDAGTPPPVLVFSGYGTEQFNNIPVVLRSVNFTLPEDVDYVSIKTQNAGEVTLGAGVAIDSNGTGIDRTSDLPEQFNAGAEGAIVEADPPTTTASVPAESSTVPTSILYSLDLAPQYPPSQLRDEWNLKDYASGDLLRKGYL